MKSRARQHRNGATAAQVAAAAPPTPAPAGSPFPLDELHALHHALGACPPDRLYAAWMSAARRVERLIEEAHHG